MSIVLQFEPEEVQRVADELQDGPKYLCIDGSDFIVMGLDIDAGIVHVESADNITFH